MRIRQLAKLNAVVTSSSTSALQVHVCLLNQSPWDVITDFSPPSSPMIPPPPQVNGNCLSGMNESSGTSIPIMEWEEYDDNVSGQDVDRMTGDISGGAGKEKRDGRERFVLCGKTDGRSWRCKREAKYGNSLCEHHLALACKKNSNKSSDKNKKTSAVLVETKGGKQNVRTKKPSTAVANPDEIYYYSGFGPRWGERRVNDNSRDNNFSTKSLEHKPITEPSSTKLMEEGLDYIDVDDDEEEEGLGKRKRARKPVKAKSLKSIM